MKKVFKVFEFILGVPMAIFATLLVVGLIVLLPTMIQERVFDVPEGFGDALLFGNIVVFLLGLFSGYFLGKRKDD